MDRRMLFKAAIGTTLAAMLEIDGKRAMSSEGASPNANQPKVLCGFVRFKERFRMGWPGADYDVDMHQEMHMRMLRRLAEELGLNLAVQETPISDAATSEGFAKRVKLESPDGVVLVNLTRYLWGLIERLTETAVPTIILSPIGTSFAPQALSCANRVGVVVLSTIEFEAIRRPLIALKAAWKLRNSRILVIAGDKAYERKLNKWGTTLTYEPWERYPSEIELVPIDSAVYRLSDAYRRCAQRVIEPSIGDIVEAARVFIACERLLNGAGANAITMDCLPHVRGRKTPPPCVAWSRFNDLGIPAGCEADIMATLSLMLSQYFLERPGFMGNPVAETVHNQLVIAHCTSPTRLFGATEKRARFLLRSHAESGRGVAIQALFPEGERVTIFRFLREDQMLLGSGTVVRNMPHPPAGGCRTMIAIALDEPKEIRMLRDFHHPVVVVGDFKRELEMFCQMFGVSTVPLQRV